MQQVIGLASYVGYKYRYDLLYYINTLARHTLYPNIKVITLAKELIQYLWTTRDKRLIWRKEEDINDSIVLYIVCDASFSNQEDYKSQYGQIARLNKNPIFAISSRITIICTSSTEAELYSISHAIPELDPITRLLKQIQGKPIKLKIISNSIPAITSINKKDDKIMKKKFYAIRLLRLKEERKEILKCNMSIRKKTLQTY